MEFSEKDRLILINQYEILSKINNENQKYYNECIEILRNGFEILYSKIAESLYDPMAIDDGKIVMDVLSIYRAIEDHKRRNPKDEVIINHTWGHFVGFDGNNETNYLGLTRFLIETQGIFSEQLEYRDRDDTDFFNCHFPVLGKYINMIDQWNTLKKDLSTQENILSVLDS